MDITPRGNDEIDDKCEKYIISLMRVIKKNNEQQIQMLDRLKINIFEIKLIKDLKYYIIDYYKTQNFCPCMLMISRPLEDGYYCSEEIDTPDKNILECFPDKKIYININYDQKCDCGFRELESLSKREIYEKYIKKINELKKLLELEKTRSIEKIKEMEEINNEILNNFDKKLNINKRKKTIKNDKKNNNNILSNIYFNTNFEDFYDIIIDINSIKNINTGWKIKMNERGKNRFNEFKDTKALIIGVIGNSNKGKSFLLSQISKLELPNGTSIRTEGLSIKYPELAKNKNGKIILY